MESPSFTNELVGAQPLIYSYVASCLPGYPGAVRDVVQRVNEALIRREGDFDPARPFVPWAIGFAKLQVHAFLNEQRKGRVFYDSDYLDSITDSYAAPEPERSRYRPDDLERLEICKSRLREQQRKLLDLRYGQELAIEEIARLIGSKAKNVKSNLSYIRSRLADCIRKRCELSHDKPSSAPPMSRLKALTSDLLDGGRLAQKEAQSLHVLLRNAVARESYLDELEVHALLAWSSRDPEVPAVVSGTRGRPSRWPRVLAAAGLAVLLAGLAYGVIAARSGSGRSIPVTVSAAKILPSVPRAVAVAAEAPAGESIPKAAPMVVAAVQTQQKKEKTVMLVTNQVKMAVAVSVMSAAVAVLPMAADTTSVESSGFDLDTRDAASGLGGGMNLEARDFSTALKWDFDLLTTKPQGWSVFLR